MGRYTVERGDTLRQIAHRHGLSSWRCIYYHPANAQFRRFRPDPYQLQPGDQLLLPTSAPQSDA